MLSLRQRILLISLLAIIAVMTLTGLFFSRQYHAGLERRLDQELIQYLEQIAAELAFDENGQLEAPANLSDQRFQRAYSGYYWQVDDPLGNELERSRSMWDFSLELPVDIHVPGTMHRYEVDGPVGQQLIVQETTLLVATPTGTRHFRISAAASVASITEQRKHFTRDLIPYLLFMAALLAASSWLQSYIALNPLRHLPADLKRVERNPGERLHKTYPAEIQPLVGAVNHLLDTQDKTLETARKRAADLAHGLKSALTALQLQVKRLALKTPDTADNMSQLIDVLESKVHQELARSRLVSSPSQRSANASLGDSLTQIIRTLQRTPRGELLDWNLDLHGDYNVAVDPHDLMELLGNILENAGKWANNSVHVLARTREHKVLVRIDDDGPGVDLANIDKLSERGLRADQKVAGTGLGLAIVRDIADIYHIGLHIQNRRTAGLRVELEIPRAA